MTYTLAIVAVVGLLVGFVGGFWVGFELASRRFLRAQAGPGNGDNPKGSK